MAAAHVWVVVVTMLHVPAGIGYLPEIRAFTTHDACEEVRVEQLRRKDILLKRIGPHLQVVVSRCVPLLSNDEPVYFQEDR